MICAVIPVSWAVRELGIWNVEVGVLEKKFVLRRWCAGKDVVYSWETLFALDKRRFVDHGNHHPSCYFRMN